MSGLSARMQGIPKEEKRPGHLNLKGSRHSRPEPHLMTPRQEAKAPLSLPDRPPEHAETGNHAQSSSCGSLPHRPRHCGGLESRGGACRQLRRGAQRLRRRLQQPGNHPGRVPGLLQPLLDSNLPGYRHPVPPWRSNRLQQRLPVLQQRMRCLGVNSNCRRPPEPNGLPKPVLYAVQELPQPAGLRRRHDYLPIGLSASICALSAPSPLLKSRGNAPKPNGLTLPATKDTA